MKTTGLDLNLNKQNKVVLRFLFLLLMFFAVTVSAQQGINYKAIIKDGEGYAIANGDVTIQFTILKNGTENVYRETHDATTDANGIVIVNIGEGSVESGVFDDIDWGANSHYLKTEINTGSGLTDMGTTEFKTVPYALHAQSSSVKELNDLSDVKTGGHSVFIGEEAGANDDGNANYNTSVGNHSLYANTTGKTNSAFGAESLNANTSGDYNTGIGNAALRSNITGNGNVAIGHSALSHSSSGNYNVAIGQSALNLGFFEVGDNNIAIGYNAKLPDNRNSNQVRIGNSSIEYAGIQVAWTVTSDKRWKENIQSLPHGLDMLMQLKPVEYNRINNENKTKELGFIAQDLEELLEDMGYTDLGMLTKDDEGYLHLRYNDFIALLTKAIQEQQEIINRLNEKLEMQVKNMRSLNAELFEIKTMVETLNLPENYNLAEK